MTETERSIPLPEGAVTEIVMIRRVMAHRYREAQPQINQPAQDTIPGTGSGDQ